MLLRFCQNKSLILWLNRIPIKGTILKNAFYLIALLLMSISASAKHIAGGEMSYKYLGPGVVSNSGRYLIMLKMYRDCDTDGAKLDPNAAISIYAAGSSTPFATRSVPLERTDVITLTAPDPCISNPPRICYEVGNYSFEIELPFISGGYTVAYQRCCRIDGIFNLINSAAAGATYSATIPGTDQLISATNNNSPVFKYDFGATDQDGDNLEYRFEEAYLGGSTQAPAPSVATAPPYLGVSYNFGFSAIQPLGPDVLINPTTGLISGTAPNAGIYVITVAVVERRNGKIINVHRKDLHLKIANCQVAAADLEPSYITCDGLTLNFFNKSNSPLIKSYEWDFGIANSTTDISTLPNPSFTFPAPGNYTVRLITNKNDKCSDTGTAVAKVYPGFVPAMTVVDACNGVPYSFRDNSRTAFGLVDKWKWDFGNSNATNDTANTSSAAYTYTQNGTYTISLIVGNSLGCIDTVTQQLNVGDKPSLTLPRDTTICTIDTLRLNAIGSGNFSWSPNYMISNTSIANPLVSPDVPTRYTVTLRQASGCENTASIFVDVKSFVSLKAGNDTTICLGDSILLKPISDGVNYTWTPASMVSNPTAKVTWAKPTSTTRISVLARIGKCQANDGFLVTTIPYPAGNAGKDTAICFGDQARLAASGGSQYLWYPGITLDDQTAQFPIARPYETTDYVVGVYDNKGCPKPTYDSVRVTVIPPVRAFAGRDTVAVIGQPLQLLATGGALYNWNPPSFLNNPNIPNPIAKLNDNITYIVKVSTPEGCYAFDTVNVKVYKTPPEIFVPTAFTPNDDNLNDRLIPIPVGISQLVYFKVYNRYGELVFQTEEIGKGWNGVYKGKDQGNESFVWHALGVDYLGNPVFRKGQSTLVR
jgi:gliding motility-associated-like protein